MAGRGEGKMVATGGIGKCSGMSKRRGGGDEVFTTEARRHGGAEFLTTDPPSPGLRRDRWARIFRGEEGWDEGKWVLAGGRKRAG